MEQIGPFYVSLWNVLYPIESGILKFFSGFKPNFLPKILNPMAGYSSFSLKSVKTKFGIFQAIIDEF